MKKEIEARLLNCNVQNLIEKLKSNNATFIGDWLQIRKCFDFNPKKENSWIRLRTNGQETTLTIKEIRNEKIDGTNESEIIVSDFYQTEEILNKLGYYARSNQENRRIRFVLDNVEIDIDFWPFIPCFAEFEAQSEQNIKDVCSKINIDYSSLTTKDVTAIYSHYSIDFDSLPQIISLEEERKNIKYNT